MELKGPKARMPGERLSGLSRTDESDVRTFAGFFVAAGLMNATIAALLLCRLPDGRVPSPWALLVRSALYVAVGAAAGVAGAYVYWRLSSNPYRLTRRISFRDFSLVCAAGWVWVPAAVLLSAQDSKATALIGILGGALLGAGLQRAAGSPEPPEQRPVPAGEGELFAATLQRAPGESRGYAIAIALYSAAYAQREGEHLTAGLMGAIAAFLFAWYRAQPADRSELQVKRNAEKRLARTGALAVLVTAWALLLGVAHRNAAGDGAFAAGSGDAAKEARSHSERSFVGGGFESVILWPLPPKKQIIPPLPAPANYLGLQKSRPMVIRFDGVYWYFQPPDTRPGRMAHQARGTPLSVNIQSMNSFPLMMEAHQRLIAPVRLSRCRELAVEIENRDNRHASLSIGVLLGDSQQPHAATLYLGERPIQAGFVRNSPALETVRFVIPGHSPIRKFDEITVTLLPDQEHLLAGPKISIQRFELFPR